MTRTTASGTRGAPAAGPGRGWSGLQEGLVQLAKDLNLHPLEARPFPRSPPYAVSDRAMSGGSGRMMMTKRADGFGGRWR